MSPGEEQPAETRDKLPLRERVPDLKQGAAELKERTADLRERVPELKERGAELAGRGADIARQYARMDVRWTRWGLARVVRESILTFVLGPAMDFYIRQRVIGREIFEALDKPVIFVANHSSHLDTPVILRSLPRKWRSHSAVAAAADYFYKKRLTAHLVALVFSTVPIARQGGSLGNGGAEHVDRLLNKRWNLVLYPEGTRTRDGRMGKLRSGAAVIAVQHGIDIVPIYITGSHEAMPPGRNWPKRVRTKLFFSRRHDIVVRFGEPVRPEDGERPSEVMARVRAFYEREGAPQRRAAVNGSEPSTNGSAPEQPAATAVH